MCILSPFSFGRNMIPACFFSLPVPVSSSQQFVSKHTNMTFKIVVFVLST